MNENCTLERLENDIDAATVYIAFFEPKIQQDAIELIYHKRKPGVNLQWVYKKRQELEREGYLIKCDTKLRGSTFKSNTEPIVNTIRKEIEEKGSLLYDDEDSFEALNLILDSTWFREFYSWEHLEKPFSYTNKKVHSTYQFLNEYIAGDRLKVINIKHLLLNLVNEIGNYCYTYNKLLSSFPNFKFEDKDYYPDIQELIRVGNFDNFYNEKSQKIPDKAIDLFYNDLVSDKENLRVSFNRMEEYLSIEKESRFESTNKRELSFESVFKGDISNISPNYAPERELGMPPKFINSIKKQSALIPISVSNIMRKCYHGSSLAVEERCESLLDQYQEFF